MNRTRTTDEKGTAKTSMTNLILTALGLFTAALLTIPFPF